VDAACGVVDVGGGLLVAHGGVELRGVGAHLAGGPADAAEIGGGRAWITDRREHRRPADDEAVGIVVQHIVDGRPGELGGRAPLGRAAGDVVAHRDDLDAAAGEPAAVDAALGAGVADAQAVVLDRAFSAAGA